MELIIEGKRAALKPGSSFDYVSENRAFSDADDYTLSITLPLAGCPENLEIFGRLDRMDSDSRAVIMEASIVDHTFTRNGVVTVVDANEKELKCQFLEGRSVQNFDSTFDDRYINELPLGVYPMESLPRVIEYKNIDEGAYCVPLPWVNDSADGFLNNEVLVEDGAYKWANTTEQIGKLSYMPYLIYIAKKICNAVGYTCDFSEWEQSDERFLLVCNVLPASWDINSFARALPHWTVAEFFDELEKILVCEINIDHRTRHIGMTFSRNVENVSNVVKIDDVLDSFTSEIAYGEDMCEFKGAANIRYADRGDEDWKREQCQWLIDLMKTERRYYREFDTLNEYLSAANTEFPMFISANTDHVPLGNSLMYIKSLDLYGMWKVVKAPPQFQNGYYYQVVWINRFGDLIRDADSDNDIVLQMVPARVSFLDSEHSSAVFLAPSGYSEENYVDDDGIKQPIAFSNFSKGEPDSAAEYYDKMHLAYWGVPRVDMLGLEIPEGGVPYPTVDGRFSLKNRYADYLSGLQVNPKEKLKVSWLGSAIPDVRSIFHIRGKRYLCEKITATFTENGMSQLLKGEFYPLVD